jgi:DegV family protein with EDD domain
MNKVTIVTDSVASLPADKFSQYGLQILPINISFMGKIYRDGVDLTAAQAYQMLKEKPDQFFTSPVSVGECLNILKDTAKQSESILCITLSSKLSGMYNVALLAMKLAKEESLNIPIELIDSKNATVGEGLIVLAAAEAAASGKNLAEVKQLTLKVRDSINLVGIFDTIRYVYRTGRIPKLTAQFGSILNIRPVFSITEGTVHITGIIQNQESGIKHILKQMKEHIRENPVHVAIAHADAHEAGMRLKDTIQNQFDCIEIWLTDFSPVMAYATGTGVLVVAYYIQ